ncbi:uncharacterized protein LOC125228354 [Leguminivora glycinivorella]|uniref:uncharacterized protein LOC125228354 n=1 Tax=Leguminivora glycinivorella TaxID=1035111 RepID=UPI00200E6870|nr:uncharacterized protein LOC125228354 [Leguminivora glycinivorella]
MADTNSDEVSISANDTKINPNEFDVAVSAMLIGLGGEKYLDIFRTNNIGQSTLIELTDEDLIKFGVDDQDIRTKILEEVKNLPLYQELEVCETQPSLGPIEIVDMLEESSQHLYRIYLSMLANTLTLKKADNLSDCLLHKEKHASDIALATLSEITTILNSMDIALHTEFKSLRKESNKSNKKKLAVGTVGSITIAVLAVLFLDL